MTALPSPQATPVAPEPMSIVVDVQPLMRILPGREVIETSLRKGVLPTCSLITTENGVIFEWEMSDV